MEIFAWRWWRLAWAVSGFTARRGTRALFHHPRSSVPGMPWERFEFRNVYGRLWWRQKGSDRD